MGRGTLCVSGQLARAIRARREQIGASAEMLAQHFGVGADGAVDIEQGRELSAPTLVKLARALEVDLVWFVEQDPQLLGEAKVARPFKAGDVVFEIGEVAKDAAEGLELMRAFASIKDPDARKAVLKLAQKLATSEQQEDDGGT